MKPIIDLFRDLCLLRTGPERMPTAGLFVLLVVLANLTVSTLVALTSPFGAATLDAISAPVIAAAVLATSTWLLLMMRSHGERFTATFTALMGADLVITTLSWPLVLLMRPSPDPDGFQFVLTLLQFALLFWWIRISGFVFTRALEVGRAQGIAVAVFVVLATLIVTASLFPPPDPGPGATSTAPA